MATTSDPSDGIVQQDRTITDLLETYRHLLSDPDIPRERKTTAEEQMEDVWQNLARLNDQNGFINHLSTYVGRQYQRRHRAGEDPNLTRRTKPLCKCKRPRHVCEVKEGEIPSKIRTRDLTYLQSPDPRENARDYIQTHSGDVVIREAVESYQDLRATIYSQLTDAIAILRGRDDTTEDADGVVGADGPPVDGDGSDAPTPTDEETDTDAPSQPGNGGALDLPGVGGGDE